MRKKKKKKLFGKKFKLNYAGWAVACCLMMLMVIPIQGDSVSSSITYNEVLLNGEVIGAVADPEVVNQAFLNARARIAERPKDWCLEMWSAVFRKCRDSLERHWNSQNWKM